MILVLRSRSPYILRISRVNKTKDLARADRNHQISLL